ncbi:FmdB family zinc ribbon protein [Kineococcus auxinigenes]|uniref:FmdB family zinc ribbon protein n=1 Tax=unclassified Kineococcus TaxID=2621656 RepID=UPI003D7DB182
MPTYAYACQQCDHSFEVRQSFSDDALTSCPECSGQLRKLFNSVGIVFKGSGFYRTDSRGKTSEGKSPESKGSEKKSSGSEGSGAGTGGGTASGSSSATAGSAKSSSSSSTGGSTSAA